MDGNPTWLDMHKWLGYNSSFVTGLHVSTLLNMSGNSNSTKEHYIDSEAKSMRPAWIWKRYFVMNVTLFFRKYIRFTLLHDARSAWCHDIRSCKPDFLRKGSKLYSHIHCLPTVRSIWFLKHGLFTFGWLHIFTVSCKCLVIS